MNEIIGATIVGYPDPEYGFTRLGPVTDWLKANGFNPDEVTDLAVRQVELGQWRAQIKVELDTTPFPYDQLKEMGKIE